MKKNQNEWLRLPEDKLKQWQITQLQAYLQNTVLPFSKHYRELFHEYSIRPGDIRSFRDLEKIPFTTKLDLLSTPDHPDKVRDFALVPDKEILSHRPSTIFKAILKGRGAVTEGFEREFRPLLLTSTTGRSSEPVPFVYTQKDIENLSISGERVMKLCGASKEDRMLNVFPFAPHLAFWQTHYAGTKFGVFMVSSGGGKSMGTEGNLRLIQKLKPNVIIGMPTFIYHVLRNALEDGIEVPNLTKIVLGGEKVPQGMRRKLAALAKELGAKKVSVLATFGFTEAKMAWSECLYPGNRKPSGYHLSPDLGIYEIVDPKTGEQMASGEAGEIVFTPLQARGSVVLRYRTGDYASGGIVYDECPYCSRRMPRLMGEISRSSEIKEIQLDKIKGTLVDFNTLEHILDDEEEVGLWQIELRKANDDPLDLDEIILHVEKPKTLSQTKLAEDLKELFVSKTEFHPNEIVFHTVDELKRMQGVGVQLKEQRLVDHRPKLKNANGNAEEVKA